VGDKVKLELEKVKFALYDELDRSAYAHLIDSVEFSQFVRWRYDTIVTLVKGHVWGEFGGQREIRYPSNWIEAIKARWLPQWLRRFWPVRYEIIDVTAKVTYPNLRVSLPDEPHVIVPHIRREEADKAQADLV